ncbi:MAG TPA: CoA pyrophosphatase [Candidatus Eubacterium pullicola]|nr:CoA pyrophosphatase [Candidatus Eubacterium pullicola]
MINIEQIKDKLQNRKLSTVGRHTFFSVLVPFVEIDGEIHILYEIRSQVIPTQPGEVCFPGGAIEPGETAREAAIRETCEEIGIPPRCIEIFAEGDRLITQANFTMYSFMATIPRSAYENVKLNEAEVDQVFTVPLEWFMHNDPEVHIVDLKQFNRADFPFEKAHISPDYKWRSSNAEVPIYNFEDKAIWGLTARITRNMVQILKGEKK